MDNAADLIKRFKSRAGNLAVSRGGPTNTYAQAAKDRLASKGVPGYVKVDPSDSQRTPNSGPVKQSAKNSRAAAPKISVTKIVPKDKQRSPVQSRLSKY